MKKNCSSPNPEPETRNPELETRDPEPETSNPQPRILLCNDDGIHAPGIAVLHEAVTGQGDLTVVAPDVERSAAGHAITLSDPLKCSPVEKNGVLFGHSVSGTPADCIKLAVRALMEDAPPTLTLSGINLGSNTGISVLYSGTVSAATESAILGVPGIAFSLCSYVNPQWDMAGRIAAEITAQVLENPFPTGVLLNVNIPNLAYDDIKGIRVTRMGRSRFIEKFHRRLDPQGRTYFWLDGDLEVQEEGDDIDELAVRDGYVSVTPIQFDMTAYDQLDCFRALEK